MSRGLEGTLLSDKYRLIRLLGKGGMGSVWLAEHTALKTQVAVKLIDSELGKLPKSRARFVREAQLAARIRSVHVVQVYDSGEAPDGRPYIAMEYLVGEALRDRLDRGRLTITETGRIVSHVTRGLARAHDAGLIHRDLKPDNVFMAREGDDEVIKVLDCGVAKASDALSDSDVDPTRTGALVGTPYYMSPEQAQGLKTIDIRTDLWSMGVLVYECLTGHRPFTAEALGPLIGKILVAPITPPSVVAPDARLPPQLDAWMARALARDPNARFSSAKELADAFVIATGAAPSMDRDPSIPAFAAAASTAGPASQVVDSKRVGLEETARMEGAPRDQNPLPVAMIRTHDSHRSPASPSSSRLPWILVAVLGAAVVALAAMLAFHR